MCVSRVTTFILALLTAMSLPVFADAADKRSDAARDLARRLQLANRKIEQEKAQLVRDMAASDAKAKELEEQLETVQRKVSGISRRVAVLEADAEALRAEKDGIAAKLDVAERKLGETENKLRAEEIERKRLEALAAQQKQSIASCEEHNAKLHSQGVALLEKYQSKSCFDAALQAEPFTGLKQVEIENFVEDSRDKLDEHRIEKQAGRMRTIQ